MITVSASTLWIGLIFIIAIVVFVTWKITTDYWLQHMSERVVAEWEKWKKGQR